MQTTIEAPKSKDGIEATYSTAVCSASGIISASSSIDTRPEDKIAEWQQQYGNLVITNLEDKEGYKRVKEARSIVRDARLNVERVRKDLKADALEYGRIVDNRAKQITALLLPLENELAAKLDEIDNEKERIKQEKLEAEQRRIDGRKKQLFDLGMQFNGTIYQLGDTTTNDAFIKQYTDEQFTEFVGKVQSAANAIAEAAKEKERVEALWRSRLAQLKSITWDGVNATCKYAILTNPVIVFTHEQLSTLTDDEFNALRDKHNGIVEADEKELIRLRDAEKEAIRQQNELVTQRNAARWESLKLLGFEMDEDGVSIKVNLQYEPYTLHLPTLYSMNDADFTNMLAGAKLEIETRKQRGIEYADKVKSDKEVLSDFCNALNELYQKYRGKELTTPFGKNTLATMLLSLEKIVAGLKKLL